MFLVMSALAYLAISMAIVLGIDFAISHRYRPRQSMKGAAAPAYAPPVKRSASRTGF